MQENLENPLRHWDGREGIPAAIVKKTRAAFLDALRQVREANNVAGAEDAAYTEAVARAVSEFLEVVGALNRKHEFLYTLERDEVIDAVDMLAAQLSEDARAALDPARRLSQPPLAVGWPWAARMAAIGPDGALSRLARRPDAPWQGGRHEGHAGDFARGRHATRVEAALCRRRTTGSCKPARNGFCARSTTAEHAFTGRLPLRREGLVRRQLPPAAGRRHRAHQPAHRHRRHGQRAFMASAVPHAAPGLRHLMIRPRSRGP
jgi:hypothetical protein